MSLDFWLNATEIDRIKARLDAYDSMFAGRNVLTADPDCDICKGNGRAGSVSTYFEQPTVYAPPGSVCAVQGLCPCVRAEVRR